MKKIFRPTLTFLFFFAFSITSYANDINENQYPTDEQASSYALHFMQTSQEDSSIEIDDFVRLYGTDGMITGYYITFQKDGQPAGYTLLSLVSGEDPLVEFSFESNGVLGEQLEQEMQANSMDETIESSEQRIIYNGAGLLYKPLSNGEYYSVYEGKNVSISDTEASAVNATIGGGIIDWSDANLNTNSIYKIPLFGYGTDYWIMTDFSSGGVCYPTAATNILWYWGNNCGRTSVMNNSRISGATTLWAKAQAIFGLVHQGMLTVDSSGTFDFMITNGYANFFGVSASSTGVWNYKKISKNSAYSEYKAALNGQCPIHLVLHTKAGTILRGEGHGVYCFGYASSNTGVNYLFVMDGWNRGGRFVKFNYYPQVFGYKIYVR